MLVVAAHGSRRDKRWVLIISVNHGALWGGSGVQYFIGNFDGTRFTADAKASAGTLTSPPSTITKPFISFLIAGGRSERTRAELQVDGQMVHRASGDDSNVLKWASWDVSALIGQQAQLRAVDEGGSAWGHLVLDHIVMGNAPVLPPNLADVALWADHGRDFYAPISFANMQDGRVLWLGWMANWDYARVLPTQPWRGQQSLPRQLDLVDTPLGLRLRQRVVDDVRALVDPQPLLVLRSVTGGGLTGGSAAGVAASTTSPPSC